MLFVYGLLVGVAIPALLVSATCFYGAMHSADDLIR